MNFSVRTAPRAGATYLRLGTRNSALARVGAALVAGALRDAGVVVEVVPIVTAGDVRPTDTEWDEGAAACPSGRTAGGPI